MPWLRTPGWFENIRCLVLLRNSGSEQPHPETSDPLLSRERLREGMSKASRAEQASGASQRADGQASGPVLTLRFLAVMDHSVR